MFRMWRRFRAMADAERARVLAIISASAIVGLLYGLGGLSLYLRASYLQATPTALPIQDLTELPPLDQVEAPTLFPTVTPVTPASEPEDAPTPTLFPTLTPRPGA